MDVFLVCTLPPLPNLIKNVGFQDTMCCHANRTLHDAHHFYKRVLLISILDISEILGVLETESAHNYFVILRHYYLRFSFARTMIFV